MPVTPRRARRRDEGADRREETKRQLVSAGWPEYVAERFIQQDAAAAGDMARRGVKYDSNEAIFVLGDRQISTHAPDSFQESDRWGEYVNNPEEREFINRLLDNGHVDGFNDPELEDRLIRRDERLARLNGEESVAGGGSSTGTGQRTNLAGDWVNKFRRLSGDSYAQLLEHAKGHASGLQGIAEEQIGSLRDSLGYQTNEDLINEMMGLYESGGLTDRTRAQLESNRRNALQTSGAMQGYIKDDLTERGLGGGVAEIEGRFGAADAAAGRQQMADLEAAAFGQESAIDALKQAGQAADTRYRRDAELASILAGAKGLGLDTIHDAATLGHEDLINFINTTVMPTWVRMNEGAVNAPATISREANPNRYIEGSDGDGDFLSLGGAPVGGPTTGHGSSTSPNNSGPAESGPSPGGAVADAELKYWDDTVEKVGYGLGTVATGGAPAATNSKRNQK